MTAWHGKAKDTLPGEANEIIGKFLARKRMQDKYINQVRHCIFLLLFVWGRKVYGFGLCLPVGPVGDTRLSPSLFHPPTNQPTPPPLKTHPTGVRPVRGLPHRAHAAPGQGGARRGVAQDLLRGAPHARHLIESRRSRRPAWVSWVWGLFMGSGSVCFGWFWKCRTKGRGRGRGVVEGMVVAGGWPSARLSRLLLPGLSERKKRKKRLLLHDFYFFFCLVACSRFTRIYLFT